MIKKILANLISHIRITSKVTYEIVFIDTFTDERTLGECRPDTKQIVIKKGQGDIETFKTLIHEITHSLAMENDFDLSEKQVLALENAIYRVIKLNKWLPIIAKLLDKENK